MPKVTELMNGRSMIWTHTGGVTLEPIPITALTSLLLENIKSTLLKRHKVDLRGERVACKRVKEYLVDGFIRQGLT